MPLLDHFNPPLKITHHWTGFHAAWANAITQALNRSMLPSDYYAIPFIQIGGQIEIDVGTFHTGENGISGNGGVATSVWAPPRPARSATVNFVDLDVYEVRVMRDFGGPQLRAAIELVSPANKDRPETRTAFAIKCAGYLQRGVSVAVIDVVTERAADLYSELQQVLKLGDDVTWQSESGLYAVAYRTVALKEHHRLEIWPDSLALGQTLPTLPLWLDFDLCVPLHLEETYRDTCASLRIRTEKV